VMVRSQLQLEELPRPFDAADALAVALCHIHSRRARRRLADALAPRAARGANGNGSATLRGPGNGRPNAR